VAVDRHGDVLAVWLQGATSTDCRVVAAFAPKGKSFGAPVAISPAPSFDPQVSFDADGNAIAVWTYFTGKVDQTQAALRPAHGAFGRVQDLSSATEYAIQPHLALAPSGAAVAVWAFGDGHQDVIQAARRPAGGRFGAPQSLSAPAFDAANPGAAIDPSGRAVATWDQNDATTLDQVAAAFAPPARPFGTPPTLTQASPPTLDYLPQLGIRAGGSVRLVWAEGPQVLTPGTYRIRASVAPPGGPFGISQTVTSSSQVLLQPVLAVGATGSAFAVWTVDQSLGGPAVEGAIAQGSAPFGAAQTLTRHGAAGDFPSIAAGGGGALAAWQVTVGERGIDASIGR